MTAAGAWRDALVPAGMLSQVVRGREDQHS